jgi:hypothetical protein
MRRGDPAIEQAGFGEEKASGAVGSEQRPARVLAAQRRKQRLQSRAFGEEAIHVDGKRAGHDDRIGGGARIDRAVDIDDLAGGGLDRLAVERFDPPLQRRCGATANAALVGPYRVRCGEGVDRAGHAERGYAVVYPNPDQRHGRVRYCLQWGNIATARNSGQGSARAP